MANVYAVYANFCAEIGTYRRGQIAGVTYSHSILKQFFFSSNFGIFTTFVVEFFFKISR